MNRRNFLLAAGGTLLSSNLRAEDLKNKENKSVIFIFLSGGISATEFINPTPNAPIEYRSTRGAVSTKSGYQLGGDFKELAKLSNKLTTVRSFNHKDANHESATHWVMTSEKNFAGAEQKWPAYGAVTQYQYTGQLIPAYVKTAPIGSDGSAWLGGQYTGYFADRRGLEDLKHKIPERRRYMLDMVEKSSKLHGGLAKEWTVLKGEALKILSGEVAQYFDIELEPQKSKDQYRTKDSGFGRNLLLARRLVEGGSKFITINYGGWDMHTNIGAGFAQRAPELDWGISTLIKDLDDRGLLDTTLVVLTSEFSRTPRLNTAAPQGRDHWAKTGSLIFAGGGFNHGGVIGTTDQIASEVTSEPYGPGDLSHTILSFLNIKDVHVTDMMGRPRKFYQPNSRSIL